MPLAPLPIDDVLNELKNHLRQTGRVVLTAPTGSGKSTRVPPALLELTPAPAQVLVLQPRRIAARLLAERVAAERGEPVGASVGYETRHESRVGRDTRLRFLTEGLMLRRLLQDPGLRGVAGVVLDEFHERSLTLDLCLGLIRALLRGPRPDLRLIVMSATLDAQRVATYLDAPAVEALGRSHSVEVSYLPRRVESPPWELAAGALRSLVTHPPGEAAWVGDVLIFMPSAYAIRRTIESCGKVLREEGADAALRPLHGSMPAAEQDAAVRPEPQRKVIVSTNVAETSITIPGVRHVIDSGLAQVLRHDGRRGLNALLEEPISQASADQRAGRAGRTAPGTCVRLWPRSEHRSRSAQQDPEVRRVDLAEAALQLAALGVNDPAQFPWLDAPEPQPLAQARATLASLGAVQADTGAITPLGRRLVRFPLHPRLARFLVAAGDLGLTARACLWAALIAERDILRRPTHPAWREASHEADAGDLGLLETAWREAHRLAFHEGRCADLGLSASACREVDRAAQQHLRTAQSLGCDASRPDAPADQLIPCLLAAFPDHVAVRREPESTTNLACAMHGRRAVSLDRDSAARHAPLLLALDVREVAAGRAGVQTLIGLACPLREEWLEQALPGRVQTLTQPRWNAQALAVESVESRVLDSLTLHEIVRPAAPGGEASDLLVAKIASGELRLEGWDDAAEQWVRRARFLARLFPERGLITYSDEDLRIILHEIVGDATRFNQVRDRPCLDALRNALSHDDQRFIDQMAPTRLPLPSGKTLRITYRTDDRPLGSAKIQDLYGQEQTPRLAAGRATVVLEILGPNHRPVQVTDDLVSFWANTYPQLKKELKRRYPRHEWR